MICPTLVLILNVAVRDVLRCEQHPCCASKELRAPHLLPSPPPPAGLHPACRRPQPPCSAAAPSPTLSRYLRGRTGAQSAGLRALERLRPTAAAHGTLDGSTALLQVGGRASARQIAPSAAAHLPALPPPAGACTCRRPRPLRSSSLARCMQAEAHSWKPQPAVYADKCSSSCAKRSTCRCVLWVLAAPAATGGHNERRRPPLPLIRSD